MKDSKRALRRHHLRRMKARAARVQAYWVDETWTEQEKAARFGKLANNMQICSCWMCGNQRKWHGPRWQEIKAKEKAK